MYVQVPKEGGIEMLDLDLQWAVSFPTCVQRI